MIFASNIFLFLFLPLFLAIYYIARPAWRSTVIVIGSYIFYAWWRPDFLLLFVGISYWSYWFSLRIKKCLNEDNKKAAYRFLSVAVAGDLLTLGYFKYANFGVDVFNKILEPMGFNTFTLEHIILPLGISFYVFQAVSYLVDVFRRNAEPARNFMDLAAFIALFPQLIAGPILRYKIIEQQLIQRDHSWELFSLGVCRFMLGFIKKVLIADNLASISVLFVGGDNLQFFEAWVGLAAAAGQLYFDFSGYSDMAIGLGMMMGFRFSENFNQPFFAQSITEFWLRWHMTLATFLRDYVFMPLVRRKAGPIWAILLTMLASGIWHGAAFSFVCWGLFFGIIMFVERWTNTATKVNAPYVLIRHVRTTFLSILSMPLFFAGGALAPGAAPGDDLRHSLEIYGALFGFNGIGNINLYVVGASQMALAFLVVAALWVVLAGINNVRFYAGNKEGYFMRSVTGMNAALVWAGFLLALSSLAANSFSPFLYFQF